MTTTATMQILHLGCGRKKYAALELFGYVGLDAPGLADAEVCHVDADPRLEPDVVCTLGDDALPLPSDSVDAIVAWHVLEHVGTQGRTDAWFRFWEDAYRVLKPGGWIYAESPYYTSIWAWSDPTHTRALSEHSLVFFAQNAYRVPGSMISPYRIACDFSWLAMAGMDKGYTVYADDTDPRNTFIRFALRANKPLKPWWED